MQSVKHNIHFPALDGLRAIAAFAVLWTHVERYKQLRGENTLTGNGFNSFVGGLAVSFFFVLSGFLITWLLVNEKQQTGRINNLHFLWKRFLRIAPLYYLVLFLGYLISIFLLHDIPINPLTNGLVLNLLLLPNIAFAFNRIPEILIQIWSIGTEVQFYLIWPPIIRKMNQKRLVAIFLLIIFCWNASRALLFLFGENKSALAVIIFRTRMDCMAIGGLFALGISPGYRDNLFLKKCIQFTRQPWSGWMMAISFLVMIWLSWHFNSGLAPFYALLFACIISRLIHQPGKVLNSRPLIYLGKISYGIYLLHHFAVYLVYYCFSKLLGNGPWFELIYFFIAAIFSVMMAMASYELFEKRFLAMKARH